MGEIRLAKGLSDVALQDIRELEKACCAHEKLNMKLNWDMLERRPAGEVNDFLYYEKDRLIGFLGLYDIDRTSLNIEMTGMVHPEFRQRGLFKELFGLAKQECINRKARRILLIAEKSSKEGIGFEKSAGAAYVYSEYRMRFEGTAAPEIQSLGITLRKAEPRDSAELSHMDQIGFSPKEDKPEDNTPCEAVHSSYLAELDGKPIGKIGMLLDGTDGYIFGFVILPEYRRKGYGRVVLSLAMKKLLREQAIASIILEVAVENERALLLYKSCGFEEITVYDYYEIGLS